MAKLDASDRSIKETGRLPGGISEEDIKNIMEKLSTFNFDISLIKGYFERKEEYAIFINKPQLFNNGNVVRKIITLFDHIAQFLNDFQNNTDINQKRLEKAKIVIFWLQLCCVETIMAMIKDINLEDEIYYNYEQQGCKYFNLFNCCSKIIIDINNSPSFVEVTNGFPKLSTKIDSIMKEFNINISQEFKDLEICEVIDIIKTP
ncbi:MAG: hypothetical protein ACYCSZ_15020 [Burkholderiales bacterium]